MGDEIQKADAAVKAEVVTVKSGAITLFKAYWLPAASLLVGFIAGRIT